MTGRTGATLYGRAGKRVLDVIGASILLAASSPVQAAAAVAVMVTSGRPAIFKQVRAGRDGRPFLVYKFRTMVEGTEQVSGNYPSADMVTTAGRLLRRLSLDELPQLLNVIRGEMSLVGPRPALPSQVARYTDRQRQRLLLRPGMTGLAQIRHRNVAPWSVRIETDLEYLGQVSLSTDLRILAKTATVALRADKQMIGQTREQVDDLLTPTPIGDS